MTVDNVVDNWGNWEESDARFAEWVGTPEAYEAFRGIESEVQVELEAFRKLTTVTHEDRHTPFTI